MAKNLLIDKNFQHYRSVIDDIFKDLHNLTLRIDYKDLAETVDNIRARLNEPFLFVIVGEVKVGKSSFVNALLQTQEEVCKVAPDPCTDTIQQIVYADKQSIIPINDYLKKITLPIDILKEIAIVDTPGTNTVEPHHQEITERFIPVSDLIIFVFEAKNPYRESAWKFLEYVNKDWRKKVIFVLQQSDLIEEENLEVNRQGVIKYANQRGIKEPRVFSVSAKKELESDFENSGFNEVREFIRLTVTGGNNLRLKVQSLVDTSQQIMNNINKGLDIRKKQLAVDQGFRKRIDTLMDNASHKTHNQIDDLIKEVLQEYDKQMKTIRKDFEEGLGVGTLLKKSFLSIFNKKESMKEWIQGITDQIENKLKPSLENKLREGVVNIADSVGQMAEIIDGEIRKNKAINKSNNQVFGDIANKRHEKMERIKANLFEMINEKEEFVNNEMFDKSAELVPGLATGGGLAIVGAVLATATSLPAMDITGGVLSGLGLIMAGTVTTVKRRQIINEFNEDIDSGRKKLEEEVDEKLKSYVKEIRNRIGNNFLEFDAFLSEEEKSTQVLQDAYNDIHKKFTKLRTELELE